MMKPKKITECNGCCYRKQCEKEIEKFCYLNHEKQCIINQNKIKRE